VTNYVCVDYFIRCPVLWLFELHVPCNVCVCVCVCVFFVICMYLHFLCSVCVLIFIVL
jgi:hypothetical protein